MPQLSEISHEGYSALFNACSRFKTLPSITVFSHESISQDETIASMAGLVPFREWRFFESQFQLFAELLQYLSIYHDGMEEVFPDPSEVLERGHTDLYHLIRNHGGKVLLSQKLNMEGTFNNGITINYGLFSLSFAVNLLDFIRHQFIAMSPPLQYPFISMPSEEDFIRCGRGDLAEQVVKFGGYESVARRLGLAFFDGKSDKMEDHMFQGAKQLWKERNIAGINTTWSKFPPPSRKIKGVTWNQDLVVQELHAYCKANEALPSVVMPLFAQFDKDDRGDLKNAISKYGGGLKSVCTAAGLLQYSAWNKFVQFEQLCQDLSNYNEYKNELPGNYRFDVPTPSQLASDEFSRLSDLIRRCGGRRAVAKRLGVTYLSKGNVQLNFLLDLMAFISSEVFSMEPPMSVTELQMPTKKRLESEGRLDLHYLILNHGGYEDVAGILGILAAGDES
eukprot:scaffold14703_cov200-Alexandrium_tamarense.AAC.3